MYSLQLKIITEMKNSMAIDNSRLNIAEERFTELEDMLEENTQSEV